MKKNRFAIGALLALVLMIPFILAACAQPETIANPGISGISDSNGTDNTLAVTISKENRVALKESLFIGGGGQLVGLGGGDELEWYYTIFGYLYNGISTHFMEIVGREAASEWANQFVFMHAGGVRDSCEFSLRTFIEDFDLTKEDIIHAQEVAFNRPRDEIEALVNWGRYGTPATVTDPGNEAVWGRLTLSLSDIDALFSGDVNELWEAFPGSGVIHDGKAYSPEWILNNIELAVGTEQIPLEEIEHILEQAVRHPELDDIVAETEAFLYNF